MSMDLLRIRASRVMIGFAISLSVVLVASAVAQTAPGDAADAESVAVEYVAHACFRLEAAGKRLVIDPYASRVWLGYDFPTTLEADVLLVTHPHYDHDAGGRIGRPTPWPDGIRTLRDPGNARLPPFQIRGVEGKHADPYGKEFAQRNTLFVVEVAGIRFVHLGDNGPLTPANIAALGRVDVLMIPIDGNEHILKNDQVAAIIDAVAPRIIVPMHFRVPALEPADGPDDLGPIDPWLEGRENVRRLNAHRVTLTSGGLPTSQEIWIFQPAPTVPRARP